MQRQLLKVSGIIFGLGLIFYAAFRGYFVSPHLPLFIGSLSLPGSNWIPSTVYGAVTVTLLMAFGHRYWSAVLIAGLIGTGFEFMQPNIIPGVFDLYDSAALWIGSILCFVWKPTRRTGKPFKETKIVICSIASRLKEWPNIRHLERIERSRSFAKFWNVKNAYTFVSHAQ